MSLRATVTKSGAALSIRQGLGLALGVLGTLVVTRIIGPTAYGSFAAVIAVQSFLSSIAQFGSEVTIVRRVAPDEISQGDFENQAFTWVASMSLLFGALGIAFTLGLASWVGEDRVAEIGPWVFAAMPLAVPWVVARGRLERAMAFGKVAAIEALAQVAGVAVSIVVAIAGGGVWAPVSGWLVQQCFLSASFLTASRFRPRVVWRRSLLIELLRSGGAFSLSTWLWQARTLVNPLVVGRVLGAEAVGFVSLGARLVEGLGFVRTATWHLSISAMSRLRDHRDKMQGVIADAVGLQVFAMAPLVIVFAATGNRIVPLLLGSSWAPLVDVFPFLASAALVSAAATPFRAALHALSRDHSVSAAHAGSVSILAGCAWALSGRGIAGYGVAEVIAAAPLLILCIPLRDAVAASALTGPAVWLAASLLAIFTQTIGPVALVGLPLALLVPAARSTVRTLYVTATHLMRSGNTSYRAAADS